MPSVSPERLSRDLDQLAARELGPEALRQAVLERLLQAVPATAACFAAADPGSLALTAHTSTGVDRRGADRLYAAEYGVPDVASHRSLASGTPVRVLSQATGGDLTRSNRYRSLLQPMGWTHELRAAASDRGSTWGFLHLYRDDTLPDFSADDVATIDHVRPVVARAFQAALLRGVPSAVAAHRAPAVWVLDEACRIVQATPGSADSLAALRDEGTPDSETPEVLVGLATMARAAAAASSAAALGRGGDEQAGLTSSAGGDAPLVPRLEVPLAGGAWLTLHAAVLVAPGGDSTQVAITAVPAGAADLLDLALLAYRLTPAERTTVALVLGGRSTKQIADELVLSPHTVQDRMQDVFAKVGVRSRRELVALLGR